MGHVSDESHILGYTIIIKGFYIPFYCLLYDHLLCQQTPANFVSAFPNCASLSNTWCWQRNETWEVWDFHMLQNMIPVWSPKYKSSPPLHVTAGLYPGKVTPAASPHTGPDLGQNHPIHGLAMLGTCQHSEADTMWLMVGNLILCVYSNGEVLTKID